MLAISITHAEEVQAWLASLPDSLRTALFTKSETLANALQDKVSEKLNGEVLQNKTGRLKDSIATLTEASGDDITSRIFVDGDVPYAAIQEYGGVTKAHIIQAVNSKFLAFNSGGKQAFTRSVNHPGSIIPERSYLRSSLNDMHDDIVQGMDEGVKGVL